MELFSSAVGEFSDRRSRIRFPLELNMYYRVTKGDPKFLIEGKTINVSSSGVLFRSLELPRLGDKVEVTLDWPLDLNPSCRIRLVVSGRVVRLTGNSAAVEVLGYEFRTKRLTSKD